VLTGKLQIETLSDWHIGSGTGRPGSIDRLVQRDTQNLPYIPAKSLTGIWRDGCERVAQGFDAERDDAPWQQWVNWLFGEQQPSQAENRVIATPPLCAQLSVRTAHFPEALQQAFRGNVLLQTMTTFVKPGVKINPHTGSALADHLRFDEMTRAGAMLEAAYALQLDGLTPEQQQIAKAILVAGAVMVERLGAKRRRGAGRCRISVKGMMDSKTAIAHLEATHGQPPALPMFPPSHSERTLATDDYGDSGWWRIDLEAVTKSPVIIHQRTVGNHQETQDYIPGTYFIPVILKQLGAYLKADLGNALMHGDVVITHANPVILGERAEAVPLAIRVPKAKTADRTIHPYLGEDIRCDRPAGQQLQSIRRGYVCLQQQTLHHQTLSPEIAAHNTIVDAKQRPDSEIGGIYTYAAIPAGSTFRLEVRLRDFLIAKKAGYPLANFLRTATSIQIGRTKKDDYGRISLRQLKSEKMACPPGAVTSGLTVWLLSDLLLRDQRLRPSADPQVLRQALQEQLQVNLTLVERSAHTLPQIDHAIALARTRRTESWQTRWGLPRPSLVGLSAGTVLRFEIVGELAPESLQALEISGLGERTAEGYGQLRFNPPLLLQPNLTLAPTNETHRAAASPSATRLDKKAPGYAYAQLVETETWRQMIRQAAGAIAADPQNLPLGLSASNLTRSKLGALRTLIDGLSNPADATRISAVLETMGAKDTWNGPTLNQVKQLLKDPDQVWTHYAEMGCKFSLYRLTKRPEPELKQELWAEAVRIFVDACVRANKRASESISESTSESTSE
jgi:CRISPR-associated protein Csx10